MTNNTETAPLFEKAMHWPPYTYRDYPKADSETLEAFIEFLGTENTNKSRKELQPWIPFCTMKCSFCYFPTELISNNHMETYLSVLKKALKISNNLRNNGLTCDVDLLKRGVSKSLKYANSKNAKKVIIVGPEEYKQKSVTIKDMESGEQKIVEINKIID